MKKTLLTFVLSSLMLFGCAYAFSIYGDPDPIIVTINQPKNVTIFSNAFTLDASMNLAGNMKYSVDDGTNVTACDNCSDFDVGITLPNGGHHIIFYGGNSTIENSSTVYFTIDNSLHLDLISPINKTYDTQEVDLNITTNKEVFMLSYELDGVYHNGCFFCSKYETELNVENGTHYLLTRAYNLDENKNESVYFTVNVSLPSTTTTIPVNVTTTIPVNTTTTTIPNTSTTIPPKFSPGFQDLPKLYASGNVTEAELIKILNNNKLNPGVLNRLIKTGKLTPDVITVLLKTQSMPPGILNKILWYFGYGHNHLIEDLFSQYNITDEQFKLILNHEIPPGTMKHIVSSKPLTEFQINLLLKDELKHGIIDRLIEDQTLSNETIEKLLATQKISSGLMKKLIENQKLSETNIGTVINRTDNPKILDNLLKNQNLTEEQEDDIMENLPKGQEKKYEVAVGMINISPISPIGKQEGHKTAYIINISKITPKQEERERNIVTTETPEKKHENKETNTEQNENREQVERVMNEDDQEVPQGNAGGIKLKYQPTESHGNEKEE